MPEALPQRLNLAIGNRCFTACNGCYQFFGRSEADIVLIKDSVARFVDLGLTAVTLSGGDPLTLPSLMELLTELRKIGITDIKLDTVGTGLFKSYVEGSLLSVNYRLLKDLLAHVDCLALPLDGWSNKSVSLFRGGRSRLYDETIQILAAIDDCTERRIIAINTVVHRHNSQGILSIFAELLSHHSINQWNLFQYTPTDQVSSEINADLSIDELEFLDAGAFILNVVDQLNKEKGPLFSVDLRSVRSRLGDYLLINSDGEAWLPDEAGRTVHLGLVFRREEEILNSWNTIVNRLRDHVDSPSCCWVKDREDLGIECQQGCLPAA